MSNPDLLDVEGVAEYLSTTTRHIKHLVATRRIPYTKVGKFLRFRRPAIDRWLAEHDVEANRWGDPFSQIPVVRRRRRHYSSREAM